MLLLKYFYPLTYLSSSLLNFSLLVHFVNIMGFIVTFSYHGMLYFPPCCLFQVSFSHPSTFLSMFCCLHHATCDILFWNSKLTCHLHLTCCKSSSESALCLRYITLVAAETKRLGCYFSFLPLPILSQSANPIHFSFRISTE